MYNFKEIENKWQKYWLENTTFKVEMDKNKEKYYVLVEFPYPSGVGLHVGHARVYTASDVLARYKRAKGYNILFPMGWDAFGAPAEQYAIKNHIYPRQAVEENIKVFKGQMQSLGLSIDWSREISTTDPDYYKWTQWQFLQFYKAQLAYKDEKEINWCPKCKTGLSNEDAQGGICERCGTKTTKKLKNQWLLRMSDYSEKLLDGLKDTNFLEKVKTAQINWIGKSVGAEVNFKIKDTEDYLKVFTTRCDTLYGATFMVISPEHKYLDKYKDRIVNIEEVNKYIEEAKAKSEIERTDNTKEKTGIKINGLTAINPVTEKEIPIWISDYVLSTYGTGAIMAVPAHDDRDYAFAKKFNIDIVPVIEKVTGTVRENEKTKNSIIATVYDEKNDKYLTINWKNKGGRLLIGGTIKKDETALECALREIKEETGYLDLELVEKSFPISHHYFAYNKNQAYSIQAHGFLFKVKSLKKVEQTLDKEEKNNFSVEWVPRSIIEKEITDEGHKVIFDSLMNPGPYIGDGIHINSAFLDGLNKENAINNMIIYLEEKKIGKKKTNYRLQDWIFSRQRFWGEPIPMINCNKCGWVPVPESELPVVLPDVESYEPTENGESPLANVKEWVNTTCPVCGGKAERETDTMPNWAGSSWYWLRYMDPHNDKELANQEKLKYWGKVDLYDGGMEHATRHLLYARFWNIFLHEQGIVPNSEPFNTRISHGMILGSNGEKMSKSKGNVVNPNDMVRDYGADALRVYEMFIGDYTKDAAWNENGLKGCKKFLDRVYRTKDKLNDINEYCQDMESLIHKTIKKVSQDIENLSYNTAVSALMILINEYDKHETISKKDYRVLLQLLNPFAPHITEELNERCNLGNKFSESNWPDYDEDKTIDDMVELGVQVNGKLRASITIPKDADNELVEEEALKQDNVIKNTKDKEIIKVIVVPNRIVNIVVK